MHNFFTPTEVIKNNPPSYPPEALLRFSNELFSITQPTVLSMADERKNLVGWLRALPLQQRRQVATFYSPHFACLLGRLFQDWQNSPETHKYSFSLKQGKHAAEICRNYRNYREQEERLLQEILLVSRNQLYEGVTLSDTLLREPELLFRLLDELQGFVVEYFEFSPEQLRSGRVCFEVDSQPRLLAVWAGSFITKQISLFYRQGTSTLAPTCLHHHSQEKDYALLWQELSRPQRQALIKSAFAKKPHQIVKEYADSVEVCFEWLPAIYDVEVESVDKWVDCPPREVVNQLTYVPLTSAFELKSLYRMELTIQIESALSLKAKQSKSKKNKQKKKRRKEQASSAASLASEQPKDKALIPPPHPIVAFHPSIPPHASYSKPQTIGVLVQDKLVDRPKIKIVYQDKSPSSEVCKQEDIIGKELKEGQMELLSKVEVMSEETNITHQQLHQPEVQSKNNKKKDANSAKITENNIETLEQKEESTLNTKLEEIFKKVKEESRDRYRKITLNRIIYVLSQVNITCKPYGSFASELSLPDSDLDISVDSSMLSFFSFEYLNPRSQVIMGLNFIASILKRYTWIRDFQLLDKAKVPLLTFNADASVYFELRKDEKCKLRLNGRNIVPQKAVVQVDVTIQPFANTPELPHCGLESTESLKTWLTAFPLLERSIILLKILLRRCKLNKTFEGGIGSYALSLLLVAYFRVQPQPPKNVQAVLAEFALFVQDFYCQHWLIDPEGEASLLREPQQDGPILKHPFDGHNMLQKSHRFGQVVKVFSNWTLLCQSL